MAEEDNPLPVEYPGPGFIGGTDPENIGAVVSNADEMRSLANAAKDKGVLSSLVEAFVTGNENDPRYRLWPERMVRSGLSLPADVVQGKYNVTPEKPGSISETDLFNRDVANKEVFERVQDMAGLAGGSTFGIKPGAASVGSGFIRPAKENLHTVVDSNFNHAKVIGDSVVPINSLKGGTSNTASELKRVDSLAEKMKSPDGYIERLIVDDAGNVIEGQHRLDALKKNGETEVPVTVIKDLERGYDIKGAKEALKNSGLRSDQVNGVIKQSLELLHETKGDFNLAKEYDIPGFEKPFQTVLTALENGKMSKNGNVKMTPVDHDPFEKDWFHGSPRIDRVVETGKINPKRATSGPMPYFTDDPAMASGYAMGKKADTSLMKETGDLSNVSSYFTVSPKDLGYTRQRTPYTVEQSWYHLPQEVKADILDKYHRIGFENREMGDGPYKLHDEPYSGLSGKDHYDWVLKNEAKGNPLAALRMIWHDGGSLIGNEADLTQIYKLAGYPHKISDATAPWVEAGGVLAAKLNIKNPLITENKEMMLNDIIPKLEEAFKRDRTRKPNYADSDPWDKNYRFTPKEWVAQAKEDYLKGDNSFIWTSIPDKVTAELKKLGYDGIIDTGGKMGGQSHKVAIPFAPDQVISKYSGKVLATDSGKVGAPLAALAKENAPMFYSGIEKAVTENPQAKMTGDQWMGTLKNSRGVKAEEMDWTGLTDFLRERTGQPVTKQEVQDYIAANKVGLKEVVKGYRPWDKLSVEEKNKVADDFSTHVNLRRNQIEIDHPHVEQFYEARQAEQADPKYSKWQLPGGENYREVLLTLPHKPYPPETFAKQFYDNWVKRGGEPEWETLPKVEQDKWIKAADEQANGMSRGPTDYKSSHWDEPNVLAHIRLNDRVIDGKKSLHVEEIQSDWHQQGRERGYKSINNNELEKLLDENRSQLKVRYPELDEMNAGSWQKAWDANPDLKTVEDNLIKRYDGVPDAPFKKSWHELALKRVLREAAEKGYDRVSWTPGEAQAARYDLSKQIKEVHYNKTKGIVTAYDHNGAAVLAEHATPEQLPNIIGKEATEKLFKEGKEVTKDTIDKNYESYRLKDQQLKVGGEGMKGFYDHIIPKSLERMTKEHGVKVQKGEVVNPQEYAAWKELNEGQKTEVGDKSKAFSPVYYIDIPQSLKDAAMKKGFPLFSAPAFVPVNHDPFEQKRKLVPVDHDPFQD